jgi:hypothetical protein
VVAFKPAEEASLDAALGMPVVPEFTCRFVK